MFVGSVKSNIGHTESAAGVAGLIKVLLMMKNGKIVPSLHVKKDKSNVNKKILLKDYNLDIPVTVSDWPINAHKQRVCCINSFGFGGSNSHAVVISDNSKDHLIENQEEQIRSTMFVHVSAPDAASLTDNLNSLENDLDKKPVLDIRKLAFTSLYHRDKLRCRTILFGNSKNDLKNQIQKHKGQTHIASKRGNKLVFVFCGVGTTWKGMCKEMMNNTFFRDKINEIDNCLEPLSELKVADLFSSEKSAYDDPFVNHISIFACQVALTYVWSRWNINPDCIVGQSVGEVAAAYASGIISLNEAVRVIYHRSKILAENTGGSMMVLGNMPVAEIETICSKHKTASIAVYSSPVACTLSGSQEELDEIRKTVEEKGKKEAQDFLIRPLSVKCAYHSSYVENCKQEIEDKIGNVCSNGTFTYPIVSTVTSKIGTSEDFISGNYWARNVRHPVLFFQALQTAMLKNSRTVFLEIGPRQVLRAHVDNILQGNDGVCLPSMNGNKELSCLYESLTALCEMGYDINWDSFDIKPCVPYEYPKYKFTKSKRLFIPEFSQRCLSGLTHQNEHSSHQYVKKAFSDLNTTRAWEIMINTGVTPFVFDHFLSDIVLVPGATYIDVGFEVATDYFQKQTSNLTISVEFHNPLTPIATENTIAFVGAEIEDNSLMHFKCYRNERVYATGTARVREKLIFLKVDLSDIIARCNKVRNKRESYETLKQYDFDYGPSLSLIEKSCSNNNECVVYITLPDSVLSELTRTKIHPAVMDAVLQTFAILQNESDRKGIAMPKGIKSIQINAPLQENMLVYSKELFASDNEVHLNSVLLSTDGFVIAELLDLYAHVIDNKKENEKKFVVSFSKPELGFPVKREETTFVGVYAFQSADWFNDIIKENKIFQRASSLQGVNWTNCAAFLFHFGGSVNQSDILESACNRFQKLRQAILEISKISPTCPIYILTENTQNCPKRNFNEQSVVGSELWGMVRSARLEGLCDDVRLIDVDTHNVNADILVQVLTQSNAKNSEFCLTGSTAYQIVIKQAGKYECFRQVVMDLSENAVLCSESATNCVAPFFQPISQEKTQPEQTEALIHLSSIVLHENSLYINTNATETTQIFSIDQTENYHVITVEGSGKVETKSEKRDVVFCFPVTVQTPAVAVPKTCVIEKDRIPFYQPGMIIFHTVLYRLAKYPISGNKVLLVLSRKDPRWVTDVLTAFLKEKSCTVQIILVEELDDCRNLENLTVAILLTKANLQTIEAIVDKLRNLQEIITLTKLMPETLLSVMHIKFPTVRINCLNVLEVFHQSNLINLVPHVLQFITRDKRNISSKCSQVIAWQFPMKSLVIGKNSINPDIPLKVTKKHMFRQNGCYILVGGLTGLGWFLLQYMAELGAGYIAVFARRSPSTKNVQYIENLEKEFNCHIYIEQVDVSKKVSVETGLQNLQNKIGKVPIRGIFQGAAVLSDNMLVKQTKESTEKVLSPKIQGSWNLHVCSESLQLDFFVMHSSITSVIGNEGQTNYGAGNSFMDSLAAYRRSKGLCGQSLNWGPLALGMVGDNTDLIKKFQAVGFEVLSETKIKDCFMEALVTNEVQCILGEYKWEKISERTNQTEKYSFLIKHSSNNLLADGVKETRLDWSSMNDGEQSEKMAELVFTSICKEFPVEQDEITHVTTFTSLGIDSMAALGFTNNFYDVSNIRIPVVKMLSENTTVGNLIEFCLANLPSSKNDFSNIPSAKILDDEIPYMTKHILWLCRKHNNMSGCDLFELELENLGIDVTQWKFVLKQVMLQFPQLRTRYIFTDEHIKAVVDEDITKTVPELTEITYPGKSIIINENIYFDLENEHPLKVNVAFYKNKTFVRVIMHKVIADLRSVELVLKSMRAVHNGVKSEPPKPLDFARKTLKEALLPKWEKAENFWNRNMQKKLELVTFGETLKSLNKEHVRSETFKISDDAFTKVYRYIKKHNFTFFNLSVCLYQLLLHLETSQRCVTITTSVDTSGHVPGLKDQIIRCTNAIPLVVDFQTSMKFSDFLKTNSRFLQETMDYSFYPTQLILEKIQNSDVRENLERHYIIMNNMETLHNIQETEEGLTLINTIPWRSAHETRFFTKYDMKRRYVKFELDVNTGICGNSKGKMLLEKFLWLLENLEMLEDEDISTLNVMHRSAVESLQTKVMSNERNGKVKSALSASPEINAVNLPSFPNGNSSPNVLRG